ncbi:Endoglucanase 1 precursor [compost metagenome]
MDVATAYADYDRLIGSGPVTPTVPQAPAALAAVAGDAKVTLSWNISAGATSYNVKRATVSGGPYTVVATGLAAPAYTDLAVVNGTTYYYVVSAVNTVGESANSAQASAKPAGLQAPAAPATLTAAAGNAQVVLNWAPSTGATSYNVKHATVNGGPYVTVGTVTGVTYTELNLTNGTTYYYVVSAVNAAGESANSVQASATPIANTPGNLSVQYRVGNANATDNMITATLNIKNTGTTPVNLSDLKLRYYLTKEGSAGLNFYCDYAQIGTSRVSGSFGTVSPAKTGADTVLEISLGAGAGTIAAGSQTGDIQVRVAKTDWTNFNEADDYSFDGTKNAFADWNKITLYQAGQLVWGLEP